MVNSVYDRGMAIWKDRQLVCCIIVIVIVMLCVALQCWLPSKKSLLDRVSLPESSFLLRLTHNGLQPDDYLNIQNGGWGAQLCKWVGRSATFSATQNAEAFKLIRPDVH